MNKKNTARHPAAGVTSTTSRRQEFESKLGAYSIAGKAALVVGAAVGATTAAHGQIINLTGGSFTGGVTSISFPTLGNAAAGTLGFTGSRPSIQFQVNALHPVTMVFSATLRNYPHNGNRYASGRFSVQGGSGLVFASAPSPNVKQLTPGDSVTGLHFNANNYQPLLKTWGSATGPTGNFPVGVRTTGNFTVGAPGYAGFRVRQYVSTLGGSGAYQSYFGWLHIKVTGVTNGRPDGFMLVPVGGVYGAYNSAAGGDIMVGATAIPEPANVAAGLALFALGAVGVREHRRRKNLAA